MRKYRICYIGDDEELISSIERAFDEHAVVREEPTPDNSLKLGAHYAGNDVLLVDDGYLPEVGETIISPEDVITIFVYRSDDENAVKALRRGFDSAWDADCESIALLKGLVVAEMRKLENRKTDTNICERLGPSREKYNETVGALAEGAVELLKLKEDLEKQNSELNLVRDELEQFVHTVSHDLKEPLLVVRTQAQILLQELSDVSGSAKDNLRLVGASVELMARQIDSLLAFSRAGRIRGDERVDDPAGLIYKIIDARGFNHRDDVSIRITETLPAIKGSSEQVKQIFGNLISNGVKHNLSGMKEVTIGTARKVPEKIAGSFNGGAIPEGYVIFVVSDNGYGIPGDDHDAAFELFNRLVRDDVTEGDGAGLAIVKRAVNSLGGNIDYVSSANQGTRMYFTLPVARPEHMVEQAGRRKGRRSAAQIKAALLE